MNPDPAYLAFDLGASSSRAILGVLTDGRMSMTTLHRFITPLITTDEGLYWDVEALWGELQTGLEKAIADAPGLKSLSVDSWGVDYVQLDVDGNLIALPFCYRDQRTAGVKTQVFEVVPAEEIYQRTGIQFLPFNTLYQVVADQTQQTDASTAMHLSIADYFNYRFSGTAVWEASMASTTQLKDVRGNVWEASLFKSLEIEQAAWPGIVPSGTVLGHASEMPAIQVVATCSHDTGCAVAAAPAADNDVNWAYISCGTWSLLGTERTSALVTDEARSAGFTHETGIDNTYRFLKNIVGLWVLQECVRAWGSEVDWDELTAAAAGVSSPRFTIDLADDRFIAKGNMIARLTAYCIENGQLLPADRASVVRLLLESLAANFARYLKLLEDVTGEGVDVIHLLGGGSQNQLLCQLTADATQRPVVAGPVEATALGNLLIQARSLGDLPEGETIRSIATRSSDLKRYQPRC